MEILEILWISAELRLSRLDAQIAFLVPESLLTPPPRFFLGFRAFYASFGTANSVRFALFGCYLYLRLSSSTSISADGNPPSGVGVPHISGRQCRILRYAAPLPFYQIFRFPNFVPPLRSKEARLFLGFRH